MCTHPLRHRLHPLHVYRNRNTAYILRNVFSFGFFTCLSVFSGRYTASRYGLPLSTAIPSRKITENYPVGCQGNTNNPVIWAFSLGDASAIGDGGEGASTRCKRPGSDRNCRFCTRALFIKHLGVVRDIVQWRSCIHLFFSFSFLPIHEYFACQPTSLVLTKY